MAPVCFDRTAAAPPVRAAPPAILVVESHLLTSIDPRSRDEQDAACLMLNGAGHVQEPSIRHRAVVGVRSDGARRVVRLDAVFKGAVDAEPRFGDLERICTMITHAHTQAVTRANEATRW